jgi:cell division protein ZapA (FtsZ GTPase activity inhibitor)
MRAVIRVLGEAFAVECAPHEQRRLADLAAALDARAAACTGEDGSTMRRLVLAALALMDEAQATGAALARARAEIERLSDLVVEAQLEAAKSAPLGQDQGRVAALRVAEA